MTNERLVDLLKKRELTLSCAESCTGGLIAQTITDVGGCSEVFMGGVVSYANDVKINILGVSADDIKRHGAVSETVAKQMAEGVKRVCKTDIGISSTGIAGPGGGTPDKPVGTVYVGFSYSGCTEAFNLALDSNLSRDEIRRMTVEKILSYVVDKIQQIY